jgi:hypothetical protein
MLNRGRWWVQDQSLRLGNMKTGFLAKHRGYTHLPAQPFSKSVIADFASWNNRDPLQELLYSSLECVGCPRRSVYAPFTFRRVKEKMDSPHPQECHFKLPLRLVVHSGGVGWGRKWGTLVATVRTSQAFDGVRG